MFTSTHKTLAVTSVALAALLALGACSKKEETTNTTVMPAPVTTPSTDSPSSSSSGSSMPASSAPMGSSATGTSTMGSGMPAPAPMPAASGSTN